MSINTNDIMYHYCVGIEIRLCMKSPSVCLHHTSPLNHDCSGLKYADI